MKRLFSILLFIVGILICSALVSCSSFKYTVKRNNALTERQLARCYRNNSNAFYVTSTYATFSVVWSYNDGSIEIYRLRNGRIKQKQVFETKDTEFYTGVSLYAIDKELFRECCLVLDGDLFVVRVKVDGRPHTKSFPLDINCLKKGEYQSGFLKRIAEDIYTYRMWEFEE